MPTFDSPYGGKEASLRPAPLFLKPVQPVQPVDAYPDAGQAPSCGLPPRAPGTGKLALRIAPFGSENLPSQVSFTFQFSRIKPKLKSGTPDPPPASAAALAAAATLPSRLHPSTPPSLSSGDRPPSR